MIELPAGKHYIHGTTPKEQGRLCLLNNLLNDSSLRELALRGGESVLDLGAGLGHYARAMKHAVGPGGRVVAIERDSRQIERALGDAEEAGEGSLVDWRQGDAESPPLEEAEWGTFDVTHARFVLEHLHDPLAAVRVMVRATRPGGRIVLADDDHDLLRLWPEPVEVMRLWRAYVQTYQLLGNDPYVGRKLIALLHQAGARPAKAASVFFGGCAGSAAFGALVDNFVGLFVGATEHLTDSGLLDRPTLDAGLRAFDEWRTRPDAVLWYTFNWAEGIVRLDDSTELTEA